MKFKKVLSSVCSAVLAAASVFSPFASVPASAKQTFAFVPEYEEKHEYDNGYVEYSTHGNYYELQPDPADTPEMPDVLKNRKPKNHVFERNEEHEIQFTAELIMPGDTFEIATEITPEEIYTADLKGRDTFNIRRAADVVDDVFDYSPEKYGIEVTGSVEATDYMEYDTGNGVDEEGNHVVGEFFKTGVNNLNCPIILGSENGSSRTFAYYDDHVQSIRTTEISYTVLAPYYSLTYRFINDDNNVDYSDFKNLFWAPGEGSFEELEFPEFYWLTDVPYTIKIPTARREGSEFRGWEGIATADEHIHGYGDFCLYGERIGEEYTELTVCWTTYFNRPDYAITTEDLFHYYGDSNFFNAGNLYLTPIFGGNKRTILFDANGGTIKSHDKWLIEVNEVKREDTPQYGENGESRIPDDGDFGFDINDYVPSKPGDTFLGWCANPSALYTSFVTKDSTIEAYRYFWEDDEYGTFTDKYTRQHLYAKWASETDEAFEKNGWKLGDDGTLYLLNDDGANNWNDARKADPSLAQKVKSIELGLKDEMVETIPARCFEGCTGLTSLEFGENTSLSESVFAGCTNLKDVTLNAEPSRWGDTYYTFFEADKDITLHVPDELFDSYKEGLGDYAYLLEKPNGQRYALTVNGTIITDDNLEVECGGGTAVFDPETNTLTLKNAVLREALTPHCQSPYIDPLSDEDPYSQYENAAIVSGLEKLTIVIEGVADVNTSVSNVYGASKEDLPKFVRAYGDLKIKGGTLKSTKQDWSFYYKDQETMDLKEYVGPGKVGVDALGDLTLTDANIERMYADVAGDVRIDDSTLLGGQIVADGNISANRSSVREFNAPEGDMQLGTELAAVSSRGDTSEYTDCELKSILLSAGDSAKSLTFKNSTVSAAYTIRGGENTKMTFDNTSLDSYGAQALVTNIPEKNITVNNGVIKQGEWNETNIFILEAAGGDTVAPNGGIYGDIDGDGEITANDALTLLRASVGTEELTQDQRTIADVDSDGEISANDALSVLRYSVGMYDDNLVGKTIA